MSILYKLTRDARRGRTMAWTKSSKKMEEDGKSLTE